ncbi:hypothetical protein Hdeb2414_s0016g00476471 [Helianthus debilis subsp. tardiflorus]
MHSKFNFILCLFAALFQGSYSANKSPPSSSSVVFQVSGNVYPRGYSSNFPT